VPRTVICPALLIVSVAWLSADQWQQFSPPPKEPSFYTGKWELAVGQHSINGPFDSILDLKVDGTKLTGILTTDTRTVEVAGELTPDFYFRSETERFTGAAWDGKLLVGSHFQGTGKSITLTGWAARRPATK
jgi:hypothetical protein